MPNVSALLTQKESSPAPTPGETKNFSIEEKPKKSGEGTWKKAKNEKEGYGTPYKILKAERKEDWVSEQHGTFHQYSVLLEPAESNGNSAPTPSTPPSNKDAEIALAVAYKGAIELVAATSSPGTDHDEMVKAVGHLTPRLLPIVQGAANPKEQVAAAQDAAAENPSEGFGADESIPF